METNAKITLSEEERVLLLDTEWILTKRSILEKVSLILAEQTVIIRNLFGNKVCLPPKAWDMPPKISKGEQYLGLPYQMLDYPRHFKENDSFALRTFFWWGHYFSVTLQTSGPWNDALILNLEKRKHDFPPGLFFYRGNDPWVHDLSSADYIELALQQHQNDITRGRLFYKLAVRIDLNEWDRLPERLGSAYRLLSDFTD